MKASSSYNLARKACLRLLTKTNGNHQLVFGLVCNNHKEYSTIQSISSKSVDDGSSTRSGNVFHDFSISSLFNRKNTVVKPPDMSKHSTQNLTKYGNHLVDFQRSREEQAAYQSQHKINDNKGLDKEHLKSSHMFLSETARILLRKNGNPEEVIHLIKSMCSKDKTTGEIDLKFVLSNEYGLSVIHKLHQAYAALGQMTKMIEIQKAVDTMDIISVDDKNRFRGEFIRLCASSENYMEALNMLNQMPYTHSWNVIFLRVAKIILGEHPKKVTNVIELISSYIDINWYSINKNIPDTEQHFKPPQNKEETLDDVLSKIRKFFDLTSPELDRVRFAHVVIQAYFLNEDFETTEKVFNHFITKNEITSSVLQKLKGVMMHVYISLGRYEDALSVFFDIKAPPSAKSYEKLMQVYIDLGQMDFAIYLFENYIPTPSIEVYVLLLKAYILKGDIQRAEIITREVLEKNTITETTQIILKTLLMKAYAEEGSVVQVQKLFDSIKNPDTRCYNELMKVYSHVGDWRRVREIFQNMPQKDSVSFLYLLDSLALEGDSKIAVNVYQVVPNATSAHADAVVRACLADHKFGGLTVAQKFFETIKNPSLVTRKRILKAISKSGDISQSFTFFKTIPQPDMESYGILLRTLFFSSEDNVVESAEQLFNRIPQPDAFCYAHLISIYGKFGMVEKVDSCLEKYPSPYTVGAFFGAYIMNGLEEQLWEKYNVLFEKYPRCFTKYVYLEAIKEAIRYKQRRIAQKFFSIYLESSHTKQTRDLLTLLMCIRSESSYSDHTPLVEDILAAIPKCVATPNTVEQLNVIIAEFEGDAE